MNRGVYPNAARGAPPAYAPRGGYAPPPVRGGRGGGGGGRATMYPPSYGHSAQQGYAPQNGYAPQHGYGGGGAQAPPARPKSKYKWLYLPEPPKYSYFDPERFFFLDMVMDEEGGERYPIAYKSGDGWMRVVYRPGKVHSRYGFTVGKKGMYVDDIEVGYGSEVNCVVNKDTLEFEFFDKSGKKLDEAPDDIRDYLDWCKRVSARLEGLMKEIDKNTKYYSFFRGMPGKNACFHSKINSERSQGVITAYTTEFAGPGGSDDPLSVDEAIAVSRGSTISPTICLGSVWKSSKNEAYEIQRLNRVDILVAGTPAGKADIQVENTPEMLTSLGFTEEEVALFSGKIAKLDPNKAASATNEVPALEDEAAVYDQGGYEGGGGGEMYGEPEPPAAQVKRRRGYVDETVEEF